MKKLWNWKWRSIPVGIVSAVLILALVAGSAFAAYTFTKVQVEVVVEEAIVLGYNWCTGSGGDDLAPYMVGGTVLPDICLAAGTGGYDLDVTITEDPSRDASEFCPGETLVIPLNLRNKSDGSLTVDVTQGGSSSLTVTFAINSGAFGSSANVVMAGHQGSFGSDMDCNGIQDAGATVLYVKIHAPGDCPTGSQVFSLDFSRS